MNQKHQKNSQKELNAHHMPAWLKMLFCVAFVLLLLLVVFRVRNFEITGNNHYSDEEVSEATGITEGDMLMAVNKYRTASKLLTKLPYLNQVKVYKILPSTVRIELSESTAAAAIASTYSTYWVLSSDGKILDEIETLDDFSYPLLEGTTLDSPVKGDDAVYSDASKAEILQKVLNAVEECGLAGSVNEINAEDLSDVYIEYDNRLKIELGDASKAAYKLQYFLEVSDQIPDSAEGVVDLSFTESLDEQAIYHPYE